MSRIQLQVIAKQQFVPKKEAFKIWINAALNALGADVEKNAVIGIRVMDENEMQQLNHTYRKKDKPTNILSFPYNNNPLEGDLAICAAVVNHEALEANLSPDEHWAHIVVHGVLHLFGHDHEVEAEALIMEALEIAILKQLNYANPYR